MRLLDTRTGQFLWVNHPKKVRYAILSHVWSQEGEQTYGDLVALQEEVRAARARVDVDVHTNEVLLRASPKIRAACEYALQEGFDYIWIDSCCIDKTSSAELSEAINSMFQWYSQSSVCYAFLHDVSSDENPSVSNSQFRRSQWFTRGWTLQELIAPRVVILVSAEWDKLGGKDGLSDVIQAVTGVDREILTHSQPLASVSVAQRMRWASERVTTRQEDEAYSLLGIFGVNIPTIYGEGPLAFVRLQEEILKQIPDQSIFAWCYTRPTSSGDEHPSSVLFATSPADYIHSGGIRTITRQEFTRRLGGVVFPPPAYNLTPHGIRATLPLMKLPSDGWQRYQRGVQIALLACEDAKGHLLALVLREESSADAYSVGAMLNPMMSQIATNQFRRVAPPGTTTLVEEGVARLYIRMIRIPLPKASGAAQTRAPRRHLPQIPTRLDVRAAEVYVSYRPNVRASLPLSPRFLEHASPTCSDRRPYRVDLSKHSRCLLTRAGYTISSSSSSLTGCPSESPSRYPTAPSSVSVYTLLLIRDGDESDTVAIHIWPCDCVHVDFPSDDTWWLKACAKTPHGYAVGVDIVDPRSSPRELCAPNLGRGGQDPLQRHSRWWQVFRDARWPRSLLPVRIMQPPDAQDELMEPGGPAISCGERDAHTRYWRVFGAHGTGRRKRFVLPTRNAEEGRTMWLTLTCDYQGDPHYPAVFSLDVHISPPDQHPQ
ncbi:Vegetative incompatibility protein HET-E-1 [Trametes pubescens]|uniref:Vegetative incompatibility protein HET-E-1 n=1 Tax=Trametes pubescens TaxID=154538 RepID=A0A1M2VNU8_TRAPU|nr:Vegetative incompatibility protein HET-E-1 [Trametes pubescens]